MATSIRLDASLENRLGELAETTGRTKAFYLRELIENGIDDLENYYRAAVVMERVRAGKEPTINAKKVRQDLGLEN